jgi:hypothetical protein
MTQRLIPVLLAILIAAIPARASVMDSWQEVQANLSSGDTAGAEEAIRSLQDEAAELEVRRMTAFAAALVTWAEASPGEDGVVILEAARQLDPEYPSSYFLDARWGWDEGGYTDAVRNYVSGWVALFRYEPTRRDINAWLILWIVSAVAVSFVAVILIVTLRYLRNLVFDARSLGGRLFRAANAWVLAVVIVLLPLFAGLGPVWLAVYLFVMSWVYLRQPLRIFAFTACLMLALIGPTLAWVQHDILKSLDFIDRVGTMLDERQMDFSTLGEYSDLETELDELESYHLIFGELLRLHGEPSLAKIQYQKATLLEPDQSRPLIFLANLAMDEGNTKRAIQLYNLALERDAQNAFAYQNLSLAFDLSRRFQEGDAARATAREIAGRSSADLGLRGLDPRIRYPKLTSGDVAELVSEMSSDQRLSAGRVSSSTDLIKQALSPISLAFAIGAFSGLGILFLRVRFFGPARECTKCGKLYRLEAGFGESSVYCSQCVSVFQKRDDVSIEQQTAKLDQIKRWERWTGFLRRVSGFLVPGSHNFLRDRVIRGVVVGFVAWFCLTGALAWVPLFLHQIEPLMPLSIVQIGLLSVFAMIVLHSGVSAWNRR